MASEIPFGFDALLADYRHRVDAALDHWLPAATIHPGRLHEAMRYAVLNGGKRFRPTLAYAAATAAGGLLEQADGVACAVELIHAYSLVHDDLPAMDNDDLRRGKPTCHVAYDEATAILVGDALQALAFRVLAHDPSLTVPPAIRIRMIDALAVAAGSRGMAGGQAIDLDAVGRELSLAELENMHIHKTGALIRAAVVMGAMSVDGLSEKSLSALDHFAQRIGLAFQIQDDILDIEAPTEQLGKTQGKDRAANKPTYPAVMGLAAARDHAKALLDDALTQLELFGDQADPLRWLAIYTVSRPS